MYVNKKKARTIKTAVAEWEKDGLLDAATAQKLAESVKVTPLDWKRLAAWAFYFAIACFVLAVGAAFASVWFVALIELLQEFFQLGWGRLVVSVALCAWLYHIGFRLRQRDPRRIYRNQAVLFLAVLANAWAVGELGRLLSSGSGHFSLLILLSCLIYAAIGYVAKSNLVWVFALLSFGGWLGAETGYMSGWGAYYLGMNYPLRFTLLGGLLTAVSLALRKEERLKPFFSSTLSVSLLYLFISLWLLSIFGNYDYGRWERIRQIELFHWSLIFGLAAVGAFYLGIRLDIRMLRSYAITFLGINLYTRFFEHFWNAVDKSVFFALLGLSFWLLARKAEKLWLLAEDRFGRMNDEDE